MTESRSNYRFSLVQVKLGSMYCFRTTQGRERGGETDILIGEGKCLFFLSNFYISIRNLFYVSSSLGNSALSRLLTVTPAVYPKVMNFALLLF